MYTTKWQLYQSIWSLQLNYINIQNGSNYEYKYIVRIGMIAVFNFKNVMSKWLSDLVACHFVIERVEFAEKVL